MMFETNRIFYSGLKLDRTSHLRKDKKWLETTLASGRARMIPFWKKKHWISTDTSHEMNQFSFLNKGLHTIQNIEIAFLGTYNSESFFGMDFSAYEEKKANKILGTGEFVDLRMTLVLKHSYYAPLLTYARALFQWHENHRFCNRCGRPTASQEAGHIRVCTACNHTLYPRVDPAVIVLIENLSKHGEPRCLLGRHRGGMPNMYSTLAGFVEPGESLEETVKREMMEEVGLEVHNVRYIASQPWPFPSSLMVGFFAEAYSTDLILDKQEVSEALWFNPAEIHKLVSQGELILSREDSIARYLIQRWVEENLKH